jgi:hypothetical protein
MKVGNFDKKNVLTLSKENQSPFEHFGCGRSKSSVKGIRILKTENLCPKLARRF